MNKRIKHQMHRYCAAVNRFYFILIVHCIVSRIPRIPPARPSSFAFANVFTSSVQSSPMSPMASFHSRCLCTLIYCTVNVYLPNEHCIALYDYERMSWLDRINMPTVIINVIVISAIRFHPITIWFIMSTGKFWHSWRYEVKTLQYKQSDDFVSQVRILHHFPQYSSSGL